MLIEHDGKTIDTERDVQLCLCKTPARYVGSMKHDRHIFEWGENCWDVYSPERAVLKFANVPQTHVRWYVVAKNAGYTTEASANRDCQGGYVVAKAEWQS